MDKKTIVRFVSSKVQAFIKVCCFSYIKSSQASLWFWLGFSQMKLNCKQHWAKRSVARSRKPPSAVTYAHSPWYKKVLFSSIEPFSAMNRPDPTRPDHNAFNGLFLKCVKRSELETFTSHIYMPYNCHIKFPKRFLHYFQS